MSGGITEKATEQPCRCYKHLIEKMDHPVPKNDHLCKLY